MKITYNPVNDYYDEVIKKNREEIKKCMTCPICGNRVNNLDNGLESGIIPYKGNQLHYNPNDDIYKILGDIFINKSLYSEYYYKCPKCYATWKSDPIMIQDKKGNTIYEINEPYNAYLKCSITKDRKLVKYKIDKKEKR